MAEQAERRVYSCRMDYGELGDARSELREVIDALDAREAAFLGGAPREEVEAALELAAEKMVAVARAMPRPEITHEVTADIIGRRSNSTLVRFWRKGENPARGLGLHVCWVSAGELEARIVSFGRDISTILERRFAVQMHTTLEGATTV